MARNIIFGLRAVEEALSQGSCVNRIFLAKESRAKGFEKIVDAAKEQHVPFDFVPQAKLNTLTKTREHQGIAASISPVDYVSLSDVLQSCPQRATVIVLDQIQHPRNLGLIIRSAAGAGAAAVIITSRAGALVDDSLLRASAGAVLRLPVVVAGNLSQTLRKLKDEGFWVYGLDAAGEEDLFSVSWPERVALVVGNETSGMRAGVRKQCDALVSIPLENELDSLNAAMAAALALFQVRTCRPQQRIQ